MAIPPANDLTQAAAPAKTARRPRYAAGGGARPGSDAGHVIHWLRGVSRDSRISVLHRFALIGIGLHHRHDEPDAVASAIGLDRACVLRAADIGIQRGWLLAKHGGRALTLPARQGRPRATAEPSTLPRGAP